MQLDETFDVVVVGFGLAGGISAINAAQGGATTLLIEKSEVPGGLSICSYGAARSARDAASAFAYLKATNDGRTPDDVLRALADGMCGIESYVRELAQVNNAVVTTSIEDNASAGGLEDPNRRRLSGNYPFPGTETFYHTTVVDVPGFDVATHYPWANGAPNGPKLFKVVHDNVLKHGVEVRLATSALRLIADPVRREVRGIRVRHNGVERAIEARRAMILACGGFEGNDEMKTRFLEGKPGVHDLRRGRPQDVSTWQGDIERPGRTLLLERR